MSLELTSDMTLVLCQEIMEFLGLFLSLDMRITVIAMLYARECPDPRECQGLEVEQAPLPFDSKHLYTLLAGVLSILS